MNQKAQKSKGFWRAFVSSSLCSNKGHRSLYCGSASILVLAAFLLSFILVGCNREDKLSPNSDNSISFSVSSSSAKKSSSKGLASSINSSLSSESSSNALASDEFYFGEIAYEQNGSSVSDDLGNFSITIEPNDGHFRESNSNVYEISSKTAYSGQYYTEGGKKYERIDWVAGDKLSLWSDKAKVVTNLSNNGYNWATYEVIGVNTENLKSKGMIMPENGGNGLWWDKNGGSHTFIGFYPAISGGVQSSSDLRYYTYELPTSQICKQSSTDDNLYEANLSQYGFMSAYKKSSPTNSLPIEFLPGFSAIEFHIKGASDVNMILKSVDIESASNYLSTKSGERNYRVGYNVDGSSRLLDFESAATKSEKKVNLTFKDKNGAAINPALDNSTPTKFTIILSGAEDITDLTITLNMDFEKNGTTTSGKRTLLLKDKTSGTPITIPTCSKVLISNLSMPGDNYDYYFIITDPTDLNYSASAPSTTGKIESYKIKKGDATQTKLPVGWSTNGEYYLTLADAENGNNPQSISSSAPLLTSLSPSSVSTSNVNGDNLTLEYKAAAMSVPSQTLSGSYFDTKISNTPESGSPDSYHNLSDPTNPTSNNIAESANTYIVNGKGYYRIPLVMGNGVKNNEFNTVAYKQYGFTDYKGSDLYTDDMSPYLQDNGRGTPTSAEIVWANRAFLAHDGSYNLISGSTTGLITTTNISGRTVYWLNFNVSDATAQGVGVIAVKDNTGIIMWSYTIWLTDYVPFNYPNYPSSTEQDIEVTSYTTQNYQPSKPLKVTFMPRNLGWVDLSGDFQTGDRYPGAVAYVRVTQTESGTTKIMQIARPEGFTPMSGARSGYSPYYQWGRKDAILPSNGSGNTNLTAIGKNATFTSGNATTLANVIKQPHIYYCDYYNYNWTTATNNMGWWCAGNALVTVDKPTVKTIYDPSPAGYTIPRYNAFLSFRTGISGTTPNSINEDFSSVKGYYFYTAYRSSSSASTDGMSTIFFPAAGLLYSHQGTGHITHVGIRGYYWSAMPSYSNNAYCLDLISPTVTPQTNYYRTGALSVRACREE